jgi:hypothetical protein
MKPAGDFMYAFKKIRELGDALEVNKIPEAPKFKLDDWPRQNRNEEQSALSLSVEKEISHQ